MNKRLKTATKEEIKQAYQSNVISLISRLRKQHENGFTDMRTGEVLSLAGFTMPRAEKLGLGFEYRIFISNNMRKARLKKRISKMIMTNKAIFLTLTFNNSFFSRDTSKVTRRRYISRFLKEQALEYVANIDYGDEHEREHYHAVVVPKGEKIDFKPYRDAFDDSNINSKRIKKSEHSNKSVSLYINKLTNHALKESGQYERLIYSRKVWHSLSW